MILKKLVIPDDWHQSTSPVRGDILWGLANHLEHPDAIIATLFRRGHGTPMGILHTMPPTGIFPTVKDERVEFDDQAEHGAEWVNYASAEAALLEVQGLKKDMEDPGWCTQYDKLCEHTNALKGHRPVFSKLGLISKQREDGTWKHRLIWDLLRSAVNASATQSERIILPRWMDLINDILDLLAVAAEGEEVWTFIIDTPKTPSTYCRSWPPRNDSSAPQSAIHTSCTMPCYLALRLRLQHGVGLVHSYPGLPKQCWAQRPRDYSFMLMIPRLPY